jgi:hypothetical protein
LLPETQRQTYEAFYHSARKNETLDPKITLMLHLAAAMAFGCAP